jgi:hypothetical protein
LFFVERASMLAGGIRSDELASETPGESPHNDQRQKIKAP